VFAGTMKSGQDLETIEDIGGDASAETVHVKKTKKVIF